MKHAGFENAVKNAIKFYADSLGITIAEAIELYRKHESTQEAIQLLVIAQAK